VPAQGIAGAILLLLTILFLLRSSETGQTAFDDVETVLKLIESHSMGVGVAMSFLSFELQMDFDSLTEAEADLRAAANGIEAVNPDLKTLLDRQLTMVEDFKSLQAVLRNSRSIIQQTIKTLWATPEGLPLQAEDGLHELERSFLDFIGRRDPQSAAELRRALDIDQPDLVSSALWGILEPHGETIIGYNDRMTLLMGEFFTLPIPQAIAETRRTISRELAEATTVAGRYRIGLFVVVVLLLIFSAAKVLQVSQYVRMVQRTNSELDRRVKERTAELSKANMALLNEIHERENIEAQLRLSQKLESIGQLAAGVAHEINTPTQFVSDNVAFVDEAWAKVSEIVDDYEKSAINGMRDDARSRAIWERSSPEFLREEIPAALAGAGSGLKQISDIVRAMKEFSHPRGDRVQPSDLNAAIENTIVVARNEWKYVAKIEVDLADDLPLVPCNVTTMNQVMLNLIVNAAQAIGESPPEEEEACIRISTEAKGDVAEICVEDNGPGVPEDLRERIFDPFFTTKDVGTGTGQGLGIAYRIVTQMHRGTIAVSQRHRGRGARFVVRLPISPPASAGENDPAASSSADSLAQSA
jgi:C4-dicarboxylate-specific signal transduction histidine kinase